MLDASPDLARVPSSAGLDVLWAAMFGDAAGAAPALDRWIAQGGLAAQAKDSQWLASAAYAAECAIRVGDVAAAEHVYDELLPYEQLFVLEGIAARFMGSVAHYLGTLAAFLGRLDAAERHLERAIAAHEAAGAVLWSARSRGALATMRGAPPVAPAAEAQPLRGNVFRREGEYWTVAFDGVVARLKDSKGLRDIALLLATPGREVAALDLVARDAGGAAPRGSDAGAMLDDRARSAYKARIAELQSEIDDADTDRARAEDAREELDALADQLASAYGLGGRARKAGDPAERARKAVTERIRDAIAKLRREHPVLGRHLKASIRTGTFCSYTPERTATWSL